MKALKMLLVCISLIGFHSASIGMEQVIVESKRSVDLSSEEALAYFKVDRKYIKELTEGAILLKKKDMVGFEFVTVTQYDANEVQSGVLADDMAIASFNIPNPTPPSDPIPNPNPTYGDTKTSSRGYCSGQFDVTITETKTFLPTPSGDKWVVTERSQTINPNSTRCQLPDL